MGVRGVAEGCWVWRGGCVGGERCRRGVLGGGGERCRRGVLGVGVKVRGVGERCWVCGWG